MKQILLGSVFSVAVACAPALAADLSYPVKAPPKVAAVPAFSWNGFYLGVNVGGAWGESWSRKYTDPTDFPEFRDAWNEKMTGFFGGGQVGFNAQIGQNFLIGLEADIQGSTLKGSSRSFSAYDDGGLVEVEGERGTEVKWFATMRGRVGVTFDRLMLYGTGGAAVGKVHMYDTNYAFFPAPPADFSYSEIKWGWTAGGGLEWAFRDRWSVKGEYLYIDLGTVTANPFASNGDFNEIRSARVKFHTFKVGLNYRFP